MIYNVNDIQQNETAKQRSEAVGVSQEKWGWANNVCENKKVWETIGLSMSKIQGKRSGIYQKRIEGDQSNFTVKEPFMPCEGYEILTSVHWENNWNVLIRIGIQSGFLVLEKKKFFGCCLILD